MPRKIMNSTVTSSIRSTVLFCVMSESNVGGAVAVGISGMISVAIGEGVTDRVGVESFVGVAVRFISLVGVGITGELRGLVGTKVRAGVGNTVRVCALSGDDITFRLILSVEEAS